VNSALVKRSAVAIAAAGVLVLGTDAATFGATGNSLILGHFNTAAKPTTLTNTGSGPALRLRSSRSLSPALAVNNDAKILHLNADQLDGRTATQLASHAVTFKAGKRGDVIHATQVWDLPIAPGAYDVSFKAAVIPANGSPQAPVQVVCGVADLHTIGPRTHIFTADSATYIGDFPAIMSGAEAVRIAAKQQPVLICTTASNTPGSDFRLFSPITASFTALNSREIKTAAPVPMTRKEEPLLQLGRASSP
jgi:hypothetical protein